MAAKDESKKKLDDADRVVTGVCPECRKLFTGVGVKMEKAWGTRLTIVFCKSDCLLDAYERGWCRGKPRRKKAAE